MSLHMQEPPSTASICFRSRRIASIAVRAAAGDYVVPARGVAAHLIRVAIEIVSGNAGSSSVAAGDRIVPTHGIPAHRVSIAVEVFELANSSQKAVVASAGVVAHRIRIAIDDNADSEGGERIAPSLVIVAH